MKNFFKILTFILALATIPFLIVKFRKQFKKGGLRSEDIDVPYNNEDAKASDYSEPNYEDTLVQFHTSAKKIKEGIQEILEQLSERQKEIYDYIMKNGDVDMGNLKRIFNSVTPRTLRRDLAKLTEYNLIEKNGNTKDVFYKARHGK